MGYERIIFLLLRKPKYRTARAEFIVCEVMTIKLFYFLSKLYWIGCIGLIGTFFSDLKIFKFLCSFGLLVFLDMALNFSVWKCSMLQMVGMVVVQSKLKDNIPSVDNYKSEISYCLPFNESWVAVNGCFSKEYSHSWGIPTQRYAYDFIMLDERNASYKDDFKDVGNYYCYGKEILSPADGIVIEINNKSKDSLILGQGKFIAKSNHIAGNYIVIKHSENEYSTLAHLKKDSIKVMVGDTVSKGQIIALCGNSGNSTEPHLHVQLHTGQSFYNSVGLPIHFEDISVSKVNGYEKYDPRPHMDFENIPSGYVTRGFSFKNDK